MQNVIRVRIETDAELTLLRPLDTFVRSLLEQVPHLAEAKDLVDKLELAFNEAFTNVCRHTYPSRQERPLAIVILLGQDHLEFRFEDQGRKFDPDKVSNPDLDNPRDGGLGVWLIRGVMDEFVYFSDDTGKNVLRLIKRYQGKRDSSV